MRTSHSPMPTLKPTTTSTSTSTPTLKPPLPLALGRGLTAVAFMCVFFAAVALAADAGAGDIRDDAVLQWNSRSILSAGNEATISAEVGYRVTAIPFRPGDAFRENDILAVFDDRIPRIKLESADAALAAADSALTAARQLHARDGASALDVENAARDRAAAWARQQEAVVELEACTIRAPFPGRVVAVHVNPHELVPRGTAVVSIADDSRLVAHFIFPESLWGTYTPGDVVPVEVPLVAVRADAVVTRISAGIDPASHTFEAWADVDNADGRLRAGMTARIVPMEVPTP
ncbi:MAG: efflux RND transporter periplasmic adaptor subunit [Planctomycetaceae bacterium]|nr:efflux RND transporter periplasmic adaptor subunit [Planctomycetaceae bacterium]